MALIYKDLEGKLQCDYEVEIVGNTYCSANDTHCPYYNELKEIRSMSPMEVRGVPVPPYMKGCLLYQHRYKQKPQNAK